MSRKMGMPSWWAEMVLRGEQRRRENLGGRPYWKYAPLGRGDTLPLNVRRRADNYAQQAGRGKAVGLAVEGLVVLDGVDSPTLRRLTGLTPRQCHRILKNHRRPPVMRGARPILTIVDEVPSGSI